MARERCGSCVFAFFATGYIYNYLTGIKLPTGFFNKGGRHLQRKIILPTDQHGTRAKAANGVILNPVQLLINAHG